MVILNEGSSFHNGDPERGILFLKKRFHCRFHAVSIVQNLNSAANGHVFQNGHLRVLLRGTKGSAQIELQIIHNLSRRVAGCESNARDLIRPVYASRLMTKVIGGTMWEQQR